MLFDYENPRVPERPLERNVPAGAATLVFPSTGVDSTKCVCSFHLGDQSFQQKDCSYLLCVCIYVHLDNSNIVSEQCQTLNCSQANIEMPHWHFWHPATCLVAVNSIKNLFPFKRNQLVYTQFKSLPYFYILAIATFRRYNRNNRIIGLEFRTKPGKYKSLSC